MTTPGGGGADLPLVAFPGRGRRILPDRLAKRRRLGGVDQRVGVRPCRIAAPGQLAVLDVVSADPAAHAKFATGNADQNLVLEYEGGVGAGLALAALPIHHPPNLPSALCSDP